MSEAAAAATALNEQAGKLNDIVSLFKIDGMHADITQPMASAVVNPIEKVALAKPGNGDDWEQF